LVFTWAEIPARVLVQFLYFVVVIIIRYSLAVLQLNRTYDFTGGTATAERMPASTSCKGLNI
jgi:hypothetical protein